MNCLKYCLFCGNCCKYCLFYGNLLCRWGSAKKNDVGQSDKTSKLIMAITVTCKITNFECKCWTFICFKRKSWELVLFCHGFFCLNKESASGLHWQRCCTPAAGSNKRTTSSFTAAALLFSSKYQPSFEFTLRRCSLMYRATRCQVKSQHSLGFVRYLRLPFLLLDDCAMLGPDATCCWEENRGNRLNVITVETENSLRKKPKKQDLKKKTLPEAQQTQGIESIAWIMFLTEINLKLFWLKKIIQVMDSIPWVRCASGNVSYMRASLRVGF